MFSNKFSIFLVFITLLIGVISCNVDVEKEEVDEVFTWEYVKGFGTAAITENHTSPTYSITPSLTNVKIIGYSNAEDSLIINLGTLEGNELTIGEYQFGVNNFFTLTFFDDGVEHKATSGSINVNYINNRIDFDFDVEFLNGNRLSNGLGDNLLIGNADTSSSVNPPPPPVPTDVVGTIEATINGAIFKWDSLACEATFTATPSYLAVTGQNLSNIISMAFTNVNDINTLSNLVGQTIPLSTTGNIINYVELGGVTPTYYVSTSGQATFVEFTDNILSMTFSGQFINASDPSIEIPFINGEVKAIVVD